MIQRRALAKFEAFLRAVKQFHEPEMGEKRPVAKN
jgi:hypothetical protein